MNDDKISSNQFWGPEGKDYFFTGLGALEANNLLNVCI